MTNYQWTIHISQENYVLFNIFMEMEMIIKVLDSKCEKTTLHRIDPPVIKLLDT